MINRAVALDKLRPCLELSSCWRCLRLAYDARHSPTAHTHVSLCLCRSRGRFGFFFWGETQVYPLSVTWVTTLISSMARTTPLSRQEGLAPFAQGAAARASIGAARGTPRSCGARKGACCLKSRVCAHNCLLEAGNARLREGFARRPGPQWALGIMDGLLARVSIKNPGHTVPHSTFAGVRLSKPAGGASNEPQHWSTTTLEAKGKQLGPEIAVHAVRSSFGVRSLENALPTLLQASKPPEDGGAGPAEATAATEAAAGDKPCVAGNAAVGEGAGSRCVAVPPPRRRRVLALLFAQLAASGWAAPFSCAPWRGARAPSVLGESEPETGDN